MDKRYIVGPLEVVDKYYLRIPIGSNMDREEIIPEFGMIRGSTTLDNIEYYAGGRWKEFADYESIKIQLDQKVNKTGDTITGSLYVAGDIIPLGSPQLGSPSTRWNSLHTNYIDTNYITNPAGNVILHGRANSALMLDSPFILQLTGDIQGSTSINGSGNVTLHTTAQYTNFLKRPVRVNISGDVEETDISFAGGEDINLSLTVNRAAKFKTPVSVTFTGDVQGSFSFDGSSSNILSSLEIKNIPDNLLGNHYVRKTGDNMTGPLTMENSGIYSKLGHDLILTGRGNVLLTAQYKGNINLSSNEGGVNINTTGGITMNTNEVFIYGSGGLQIPAGHTNQRPDQSLWDSGLLRWNSKINRIEIFIYSNTLDPDPDLPYRTGWTGIVTDDDLQFNSKVKQLVGVPIGGIIMWSGYPHPGLPEGWVVCDGQTYNGILTPDLRDRFILGSGPNNPPSTTGGNTHVTLTVDQMPQHSHYAPTATNDDFHAGNLEIPSTSNGQNLYSGFDSYDYINAALTSNSGGNQPVDIRPPFYVLTFIMRVQ
jgi:hypothetical protein